MSEVEDDRDRAEGTDGYVSFGAGQDVEEGLAERVSELANALLANPLVGQALGTAFGAREKALGAQRVAMGALDIPSAADLQRVERRLRSLNERLEGLEGEVDRLVADVRMLREEQASQASRDSES